MNKALSGVRVLDFTQVLAGPFCTMNLADFGAEVIKIERPGTGDGSRIFGPFVNGQSGYYTLVNRGKKGITLDLKRGKDIIYDMVKKCDIVVENFKPGVMDKLGYSYEKLKEINPGIIYCSISGFGQDSPMRDLPAYDIVAQGMSGMMSITGYPDTPPARVGSSLGDVSAGLYAVTAILVALYNRERTGKGQYVDVALLDSVFAFVETNVVRYTIGGVHPTRVGARHPLSAPFDIYRCKDAHVIIAVASDPHFAKLCEMIGQPDLIKDPKFDSDPHRSENDVELKAILEKFFADYTVAEAIEMMQARSIPCGPLCTVDEACENPSILKREMLVEIDQPGMGKVKITGNPMKLSETPADPRHPAPLLGQDTKEVLHDIFGYSDEQIAKWEEEKVF
ncbi:CaiB/BaiF CoA transferase family protein [Pseudoflavonifractor phocaeensis]|uniref:CaiB/BaiF CoA transferase family protein n=1 Tax=Pseudoflavonifractor phocaeensis TaxID=1870988 RepID=UPI001F403BFF|nr:CoA transferase [Pseudoflavonifractor phocaeensis]MCF2597070.1 CoA transferase [Pseudoflavonifractor phocaeensis]MDY3906238.1 CoA transferase [Lawsonibacter sp.]